MSAACVDAGSLAFCLSFPFPDFQFHPSARQFVSHSTHEGTKERRFEKSVGNSPGLKQFVYEKRMQSDSAREGHLPLLLG
jgi:hypothetical protein